MTDPIRVFFLEDISSPPKLHLSVNKANELLNLSFLLIINLFYHLLRMNLLNHILDCQYTVSQHSVAGLRGWCIWWKGSCR
jgi:hypothetical protein